MNTAETRRTSGRSRAVLGGTFIILFGVILPFMSLGIEVTTHVCAAAFFDPIPTLWHALLAGMVPLANLTVWLALRKNATAHRKLLGLLNAFAIGVSLYYTLLFLPTMPIAAVAVIFFGIGLLPLSPFFSLAAAIACRRGLRRAHPDVRPSRVPGLWLGLLLALVALLVIQGPVTVTRIGMHMADSASPGTSGRGIRWLRAIGDEETMLRACYRRQGVAGDPVSFFFSFKYPVTTGEARAIYYRVTGTPFNAVPPPGRTGFRLLFGPGGFGFDREQGGDDVGGRLAGLTLAASGIDGSIDPEAALSYTEWTLVFKNSARRQLEARAEMALPPGGVVSRLTLWIDGEEREAAFAGRGRVREAYRRVVRRRRDPVLVTTSGPDRVVVQCFPVPPDGGEMKIRIGITAPLLLEESVSGYLRLPYFVERNFTIGETLRHSVWIESSRPLEAGIEALHAERAGEALYAARGKLRDAELAGWRAAISAERTGDVVEAWTPDPAGGEEYVIRQRIVTREEAPPARVVLVVDASRSMTDLLPAVAEALPALPGGIELTLLLASDEVVEYPGAVQKGSIANYEKAAGWLINARGGGGCDNVPALLRAWDIAAGLPESAIVWICGPQPVILEPAEGLLQRWTRRPSGPRLYLVQAINGPNEVARKLDGIGAVESVPLPGGLKNGLERLFAGWGGRARRAVFLRDRIRARDASSTDTARETSSHLARLWAYDEVLRLYGSRKTGEAVELARRYQLVTPVSGAVVLETAEQYRRAGLEPVESGTVPTIPEPETWALIAVVAILLSGALLRRRYACAAA